MKVCLINNLYGSQARGGAEKIVNILATTLLAKGHEVTIISGKLQNDVTEEVVSGLRLIYLPSKYSLLTNWSSWRKTFFHLFSFFDLASALRIKKIIKENNFTVVWTHNLIGLGLLSFANLGPAKKIHTFHDIQLLHPSGLLIYQQENILNSLAAKFYQFLVRLVFPQDSLGVFPSAWLKNIHQQYKLLPKNNLVLANPQIALNKAKEKIKHAKLIFLYVGQIEKHKGVDLLVQAFTKANLDKAELIIAGTGSLLSDLVKNNLNKNITFLGQVKDVYDLMLRTDCLVIPSICYENLPTVLNEAKQANLGVLGANLGGLAEAIGQEELLFDPGLDVLQAKLNWVYNNFSQFEKIAEQARQKNHDINIDFYFKKINDAMKIDL